MDPLLVPAPASFSSSSWADLPDFTYAFLRSNPFYVAILLLAILLPLMIVVDGIGKDPKSSINDMAVAPVINIKKSDPSGEFKGDIKVDYKLPSAKDLDKIAELPVLDAQKKSRPFKSLYADDENGPRRVLVIFVRHFFCGQCQEFLRALSSSIPPSSLTSLQPPTSVVIIGCGESYMIPHYIKETSCPYPIYADPTRELYHRLRMTSTWSLGSNPPSHLKRSVFSLAIDSLLQELKSGRNMLSGGDFKQVGGEFLFQNGQVTWCHRMRNTRDHVEMEEAKKQLGLDREEKEQEEEEAIPRARKRNTIAGLESEPGATPSARKRNSIAGLGADLGRRLSNRRQSWGGSRSRSRNEREDDGSPAGRGMEGVKEEGADTGKSSSNGNKEAAASGVDTAANKSS